MSEEAIELKQIRIRLSNMDRQIEAMSRAVVTLAKVEERLAAHMSASSRLGDKVDHLEGRVDIVTREVGANTYTSRFAERIGWLVITSAVGIAVWVMKQ